MPESIRVLLSLLAAHICDDVFVYSRFISGMKRSDRAASRAAATALHCLLHMIFVFLFLWGVPMRVRLAACLYVFVVHFLIDSTRVFTELKLYRPENIVIFSKKEILSALTGSAKESVNDFFRKNRRRWIGMNLLDQGLHLVTLCAFAFGIAPHLQ